MRFFYLLASTFLFESLALGAAWDGLESACREAGGQGFSLIDGCLCPESQAVFTIKKGKGLCEKVATRPKSQRCETSARCKIYQERDSSFFPFVGQSVLVEGMSQEQARSFDEAVADVGAFAMMPADPQYNPGATDNLFSWSFPRVSTVQDASTRLDFGISQTLTSAQWYNSRQVINVWTPTYLVERVEDLPAMLGLSGFQGRRQLNLDGFGDKGQEALALSFQYIEEHRRELADSGGWAVQLYHGDDCRDVCRYQYDLPSVGSYAARLVQETVFGRFHKRFLILASAADQREIALQYTHTLYPSLIRIVDRRMDGDDLQMTVSFRSPQGRVLDTLSGTIHSSASRGLIDARRKPLAADLPKLAICEGGIGESPDEITPVANSLYFGTHPSLFGWYEPSDRIFDDTRDGVLEEFDTQRVPQPPAHLKAVTQAATSVYKATQVLPLGNNCMKTAAGWLPSVTKAGVKAVSVSQGYQFNSTEQACTDFIQKTVSSPEGKNLLWLFSAGNDSLTNNLAGGCFKARNLPNVLVVGAGDKSSYAAYSDRGDKIVDVIVPVPGPNTGTSFAAPRVGALAALIAQNYPNLNAAEIKQAILIGAEHAPDHESDSRGASFLSLSSTLSAPPPSLRTTAKCFDDRILKNTSPEKFLSCIGNSKHVKFLKERQLITLESRP